MAINNEYSVEFDDALLDLAGWKNPRYNGSKLTGQKINEFNTGDISYGKNAVITSKITALYIGNSITNAEEEDLSLVFIKNHSYINIDKILIIDPDNDDVIIIESKAENEQAFQKFITSNLKTGTRFNIDLLDLSTQNQLQQNHIVRMNKGLLLKTFEYVPTVPNLDRTFDATNEEDSSGTANGLLEGLSLHKTNTFGFRVNSSFQSSSGQPDVTGSQVPQGPLQLGHNDPNNLFFRYQTVLFKDANNNGIADDTINQTYTITDVIPNYENSTYHENKFTLQYVERFTYNFLATKLSFDNDFNNSPGASANPFSRGGVSRFFSSSLVFAKENNHEMFLTINQGSIDMAPNIGDERSITTFEIETRIPTPLAGTSSLDVPQSPGTSASPTAVTLGIATQNNFGSYDGLQDTQLMLKNNFLPKLSTFPDIQNSLILQGNSTITGFILTEDRDVFLRGNNGL